MSTVTFDKRTLELVPMVDRLKRLYPYASIKLRCQMTAYHAFPQGDSSLIQWQVKRLMQAIEDGASLDD